MRPLVTKIWGFHILTRFGDPPYPPHYAIIGRTKGGISKSCPRVPKLRVWLLRGWGRCLKVTLQTHVPKNFHSCRWGDEQMVKRAQTVSKDPHRRERKFDIFNKRFFWIFDKKMCYEKILSFLFLKCFCIHRQNWYKRGNINPVMFWRSSRDLFQEKEI